MEPLGLRCPPPQCLSQVPPDPNITGHSAASGTCRQLPPEGFIGPQAPDSVSLWGQFSSFSETSVSPEYKKVLGAGWGRYQLPVSPQSVLSPPGPWRVRVLLESSGPPPLELLVLAQPVVAPDVVFP